MAEQFVASKQLPYVLQSTKLKNFFDSTVDQWFKNEDSVFEKGYIGQRQGRLFESTKNSYIPEPTVDRYNYQLEPATIVRNADSQTISYQSTYEDLVNKLRFDGGNVKDHSRLFESTYYSYAPPIDVDKYLNYSNYYWYPYADNLSIETGGAFTEIPSKPINGTSTTAISLPTDIVGKKKYTAPDGTVFTNGLHVRFEGSYITGTSFQFYYTNDSLTITTAGTGYAVNDAIVIAGKTVGKVTAIGGSGEITSVELTESFLNDGDTPGTATITTANGTSGALASTHTRKLITYFIEGVGKEIKLVDTRNLRNINDSTKSTQDYITIERGARDGNLWSKTNGWVHKDTLENYPSITTQAQTPQPWDETDVGFDTLAWDVEIISATTAFQRSSSRRAQRPIIEFKRDIELYDYGKNHLTDVTVVENILTKTQIEGQASVNIDGRTIQNRDTILFINATSQDDYVKWDGDQVLWDHDIDSDPTTGGGGGTGGDQGWDVSNTQFNVGASIWKVSGVGTSIILTQLTSNVDTLDKIYVKEGTTFKGTEWYYDGYNWNQTQSKTASNQPPLYNLYDNDKVLLSDVGKYSSSNFAGSKIFGYKVGTGTNDIELGFPLSFSSGVDKSDIQFCNFLNEDTYTYGSDTISGYKYYKQFTYPETVAKTVDYEVNVNPKQTDRTKNIYYINNKEAPSLILIRGNTYNFKFSSPESSTIGYSNADHPFYISTGTAWSQGAYTNEYTGGVAGSRAYYGGTSSVLTFKVPSNAPDTLYYHCGNHNKMGSKFVIIDNPVSALSDATETNYYNEWINDPSNKLAQCMIQEHTVSNKNLTDKVVLEVIPTSILDVEIFKNGNKQVFGTDFTVTDSVIINFTTDLVNGDFIKLFYKTNDPNPVRSVNYYEIPKNLENNAPNDNVSVTTYSELFQHFKSIVQNQSGFTGSVNGNNNYRDTAKDLSLGNVILQHDAPLLKTMAITNNPNLDLPEALRFTKNRYQEFQLKFLNAVNNIQNASDTSSLTIAQIVDQAISKINITKTNSDPFTYSNLIASGDRFTSESHTITATNRTWGTQSTFLNINAVTQEVFNLEPGLLISSAFDPDTDFSTKALYVYKNNVQMLVNHEYIVDQSSKGTKIVFLGKVSDKPQINDVITIRYYETIQPTWIPYTPAALGVGKMYQPGNITDSTTYSSGTRNFIQCHDGSLILKYNDLRDTALLELEKRIYNSMSHIISDQDRLPLYEQNEIIPNKFNSTSWSRTEINDLLRPIFTRWSNENAVNYQENIGYAVTITLDANKNYLVTDYSTSSYVTEQDDQKFTVGEEIFGVTSGTRGKVTSVSADTNTIVVDSLTGKFQINEVLLGLTSGSGRETKTINVDWRVLNYSSLKDQDGQSLPGHWRGIYNWYYGTDRPHTHPWEMLGFSQKPIWWDQYYTWTAPSVRAQLISDIEQGIIRSGVRENYSNRSYLDADNPFKKPGFSSYVPVDLNGNLLSPLQTGIISSDPNEIDAQSDWTFGDGAPVEHAFLRSIEFPFAIQKLLYLTNPGLYIEKLWNVSNIIKSKSDRTQTIDKTTGKRFVNAGYYVHTETDTAGIRYLRLGIQNFISDYIINQGGTVKSTFGDVIRNIQPNLMYRCAGFIDASKLKIESEAYDSTSKSTSIIIPPEDINVNLYTGASVEECSYSACIVQIVDGGFKVYGYNITDPYFTIYRPLSNTATRTVRVGGKDISPVEYKPGTTYHKDEIVRYRNDFWQCTVPHVSSTIEENPSAQYWKKIKKLPQIGGTEVEHSLQFDFSQTENIDYGTVLKTRQEVYDVIVGYGIYLETKGWLFDNHNVDIGEAMNWDYSAKEFLFWSLGKWQVGDYVTLSPSAQEIKFTPKSGTVQSLVDVVNGTYSALNKEGFGLIAKQLAVTRDNDMVTVSHKNGVGIYGLRLFVKETEHSITLENSTIFNDTIYNTLLAQRQPRVKLSTVRTANWNGKLEADGFIVNNTTLVNNFEKSVKDTLDFYNVDAEKVDTDFRNAAMHLIGYQEREYLSNLGVSKRNQVKLYQGMVKQKGTTNAIDRLLRSTTVSTDQTFNTYEEWAFKVGDFGSTNFNQQIELRLRAQDIITDPLMFEFVLPSDDTATTGYDITTDETITIDIDDTTRWLKKPHGEKTLANLWPTTSTVTSSIPTAGYVHWLDSTYQAYNSTSLDNVYGSQTSNVAIGSTAWVAKDVKGGKDWNVYKLFDTGTNIDNVISNGDANTAMKVTVSGTAIDIGEIKEVILHKTYDGSGAVVMDPTTWGTHILTLNAHTPTAPSLKVNFANVAGSGAQLAVGNISGSVNAVTSTGGTGFAVGDRITFTGTTGSGAVAEVTGETGGVPTTLTMLSNGTNYSTAPNGFTVVDTNGTAKVLNVDYTAPTFSFTGSGTSGVFGEIQDFIITNAGSNYQSPTIVITKSNGSSITISSGITLNSSGQITAISVPSYSGSFNNQGFSSGITSTATGNITVKDSRANHTINFGAGITKLNELINLTANVSTAFDGSTPTITIDYSEDNGSTYSTLALATPIDLTTTGTASINFSGATPTNNANVIVRANVSVSSGTIGTVDLALNYSSKQYDVTKIDGSAEFVTKTDNTTINVSGIKLLDWKDARLNSTLDSARIKATPELTVQEFLGTNGMNLNNSAWSEGDLIWLDDDSTGKWGVYRFTTNTAIRTAYSNIKGNEPAEIIATGGYWILHSGVDYNDVTQTTPTYFANTKRRQQDKVVTDQFEKAVIYDDRTNKVDLTLVPYDPAKGILPPAADREINYKSEIDPAIYNNHSDTNEISDSQPWMDEYVGKVWWDLSTVRYIDYESHDNAYRRTYWGRLFPGASVDIYEWVKSKVAPSNYTGTGTVKSTTDYATKVITNSATATTTTTYYYWVKNATTVPALEGRISDVATVANIITSPITQGLNYFAPISQNSISVANVLDFTTKENTVLQLNYRKRSLVDKTNSKHAQWLLIKEDYPSAPIQDQIWNKMVDSLVGYDRLNNTVPDMSLSLHDRYGSAVRPRQSWFKDSKKARQVLHESLNTITTSILLDVNYFGWDTSLTTANYYEKANWYYNSSYDDNTVIDRIVDFYANINTADLSRDEIIKVNNGYNSKWELWQYTDADYLAGTTTIYDTDNLSLVRIGLQTATAKLKENVYTETDSITMATELRAFINAIKDNVFISQNTKYQNQLLFALIRYVNSEQPHVDWLFKSTYLNVIQQDTALTQKASFEKDPFNDVKTYIEEVKPYRTKIRNFLSKKSPVREDANMAMSDFTNKDVDYVANTNGTGTINPTPKVSTKIMFDRTSTSIDLVAPELNSIDIWPAGTETSGPDAGKYKVGKQIKYNGGFWQCLVLHTPGNFVADVEASKWQHINFEELKQQPDATQINNIKSSSSVSSGHVNRLAKYHYATELAAVDTANVDSVNSFVTTLADKIGFFKDLEVQPIGFIVNRDRIGQELNDFAWDSLRWDATTQNTNPQLGFDDRSTQNWYDSKFVQTSNVWKTNVSYAKDTFIRHEDLSHITAWNVANSYTVGDIVKYNDEIYVANVTHKNLAVGINKLGTKDGVDESNFVPSRWDLIKDRIYYTDTAHTSSPTFKQDYDAGKWILVQSQLDSAGFVRPNREDHPEELAPIKPRESLLITVKTYDGVTGSAPNYTGTGDLSQYKIHYTPMGTVDYLRDKFVDDSGTPSSTDDHTTLNGAITKLSNSIVVADATKLPVPKQTAIESSNIINGKPGVIWIGTERIEYSKVNGNTLSDLVRGTRGTTTQDHANAVEVYSGNTVIPNAGKRGYWNDASTSLLQSTTEQANYLTNNENLVDYVEDTYVDTDYIE